MKFSAGRPSLHNIWAYIASQWNLASPPIVGLLGPHHMMIHIGSFADTTRALSRTSNRIKMSLCHFFRWSSNLVVGKDSSSIVIWVRFHHPPLQYYNQTSLHRLGMILRFDTSTFDLTQKMYARVCIEIDILKPLLNSLWMGISKEHIQLQKLDMKVTMLIARIVDLWDIQ